MCAEQGNHSPTLSVVLQIKRDSMCLALGNNQLLNIIYSWVPCHWRCSNVWDLFSPIQLRDAILWFCPGDEKQMRGTHWGWLRASTLDAGPCLLVLQGSVQHPWFPLSPSATSQTVCWADIWLGASPGHLIIVSLPAESLPRAQIGQRADGKSMLPSLMMGWPWESLEPKVRRNRGKLWNLIRGCSCWKGAWVHWSSAPSFHKWGAGGLERGASAEATSLVSSRTWSKDTSVSSRSVIARFRLTGCQTWKMDGKMFRWSHEVAGVYEAVFLLLYMKSENCNGVINMLTSKKEDSSL